MKDTTTAPTAKTKIPTNNKKFEKIAENPKVKVLLAADAIPKPTPSAKRRRKRVEATHMVRLIRTKPV